MNLQGYFLLTFYSFFFCGIFLILLMVMLVLLQSWTLSRRLDKYLFNEDYFTPQEMAMFSSFPLSLLKTLAYIRLITFPNSLRKRFGTTTARDKISTVAAAVSHFTIALIIINTLIIFNLLIAITLNYVLLEFFDGAGG